MKRGYQPQLLLAPDGEIFAISTGSDYCAEHECGSADMQKALCNGQFRLGQDERKLRQRIARHQKRQATWLGRMLAGTFRYPQLLERKRLNRNLDQVEFTQGTSKEQEVAVLSFHGLQERMFVHALPYGDDGLFGAWDERSFAFAVRGPYLVNKLKTFHARIRAGGALFAGTFLKEGPSGRLTGVIIALEEYLTEEHQAAIAKAQREWEEKVYPQARPGLSALQKA